MSKSIQLIVSPLGISFPISNFRISLIIAIALLMTSAPSSAQIAPTSTATITGNVLDSNGKPMAGASVNLTGPRNATTQTNAQGDFAVVGMPFGIYTVRVSSRSLGIATQQNVTVTGDTRIVVQYIKNTQNLHTIANVSTSASARFNITPVSTTVIQPSTLSFEGQTSWRTILDEIPGVSTGAENATVDTNAVTGSPWNEVLVSVNGTLSYETATLLDDMPLIGDQTIFNGNGAGQGTDISLYPLNSFPFADIIRGPSAAAPSIMNSIGGSLVLRPPGQVNENGVLLSFSNDPYGGIVANGRVSMRFGNLSTILTYGVNDSPGPVNGAFFQSVYPIAVNGKSYSCSAPNCTFGYPPAPGFVGFYGSQESSVFGCCAQASSAWSQSSGSVLARYDFSSRLSASVFYSGQQSLGPLYGADITSFFSPTTGYTGSFAAGTYELPYVYPTWLYGSGSDLVEEKIVSQIGAGVLRVAALQNRTYSTESYTQTVEQNEQLFGTASLNGVATTFNGGTYSVNNGVFDLSAWGRADNRDLDLDYSIPLSDYTHVAASYVQSYYDNPAYTYENLGPPPTGFGTYLFTTADDNHQNTHEFRFVVGGNPTKNTTLDLAIYSVNLDYHILNPNDATMSTFTDRAFSYAAPRLGFVWRPTPNVAMRASAGGGFAPAPLNYLVGTNGAPAANGNPATSYSAELTNLDLQPEKSFAFDVGTDLRGRSGTVYSLDLYHANLFGQLYESTNLEGTFAGLPLYATKYGNLGVSRFESILFSVDHSKNLGLYWHASGGFTRGYLVSVPAGFYNTATCNNCANLYVVPNINFNGQFESAIPYAQANASAGYRWRGGRFVELDGIYYGNNNSYLRPAFVALNGQAGIDVNSHIRLIATFQNITGIYDRETQLLSPNMLLGAPMISGPPYALYPQEYGPRSIILTLQTRF